MSEKKRKIMLEWACPVCMASIEDGCVPAVMNGCMPFAHVVCSACLYEIQKSASPECPECRAPFSTVRPLAAFVDSDDPAIADTLQKRAKVVTLRDRCAALEEDPLKLKRLIFAAERFEKQLQTSPLTLTRGRVTMTGQVPDFDKAFAPITVKSGRALGFRKASEVQSNMHSVTRKVVRHMRTLFPKFTFSTNFRGKVTTTYLPILSHPIGRQADTF